MHFTSDEIKLPRIENGPFKDAVFEIIKPYIELALNPITFLNFYHKFGFDLSKITNIEIEHWCIDNKFRKIAIEKFNKNIRDAFNLVLEKQIKAEDSICEEVGKLMAIRYLMKNKGE